MNVVGADTVDKEKRDEQEKITTDITADIAIVIPPLPDENSCDIHIELDYCAITKAVNDYVEQCTIDPRISQINYKVSVPQLVDNEATTNLKEALTAEKSEIETSTEVVHVDNSAISNSKVNKVFELSAVEEVCLIDDANTAQSTPEITQTPIDSSSKQCNLEIRSASNQLYIQNPKTAQLYWENASPDLKPANEPFISQETMDSMAQFAADTTELFGDVADTITDGKVLSAFKNAKVGDNRTIYYKAKANGNPHYKIVGKVTDKNIINNLSITKNSTGIYKHLTIKNLGFAGKVASYSMEAVEAVEAYNKADTVIEKSEVVGETAGKIVGGATLGAIAGTVIVSLGITAATPVAMVLLAGATIVAITAASTYGENEGKKIGRSGGRAIGEWLESFNTKK